MKFRLVESNDIISKEDEKFYQEILNTFKHASKPQRGSLWILPNGEFLYTYVHNEVDSYLEDTFGYDVMQNRNGFLGDKINCIRVNDGKLFSGEVYIQLPDKLPTSNQFYSLEEWIDNLREPITKIDVSAGDTWVNYNLSEVDSSYIIKRIKRYYASGRLYEQKEIIK